MRKLLFILLFLLLPTAALAATHTVCSSGCDYTQTTFEALSGTGYAGDTFYFSGTFSSELDVGISGTSGNPVILDGYEADECDPINSSCSSSAIINHTGTNGLDLTSQSYVTIQDFRITNAVGAGILLSGSTNIIIKRNELYNLYNTGDDDDTKGINANSSSNYVTIGGASGDGNNLHHIGKGTGSGDIDFVGTDDVIISYNKLWSDGSEAGIDGIVLTSGIQRILIEYNTIFGHQENEGSNPGEDGIDVKGGSTGDVIIRFNHVYSNGQSGINTQHGTTYLYIYGNKVYDNGKITTSGSRSGIQMYQFADSGAMDHIYIWSNIIYDNPHRGIGFSSAGISIDYVYVYNNTIAENGLGSTNNWVNFWAAKGANHKFKNNIIYKSRPAQTDYRQAQIEISSASIDMDYNTYHWPSQTSKVYFDGADRTIATLQSSYSQELNGNDQDPYFTNAASDDYTLNGTQVDDGLDLSECFNVTIQGVGYQVCLDEAIDPNNTNWSATPPTVAIVDQDNYGSGWERGAHIYNVSIPSNTGSGVTGGGSL